MLRSTPFLLPVALAVLGGVVVACNASLDESSLPEPAAIGAPDDTGSSGTNSPKPLTDAGTTGAVRYRGNPLCNSAQTESCTPDDDANQRSPSGRICAALTSPPAPAAPDAGGAGSDGEGDDPDPRACRLTRTPDGTIVPACSGESTLDAPDGARCEEGSDCAPGYDCVVNDKGAKSCRHYCCAGTCSGNMANGNATFCDVQTLAELNHKAPVCMPIKRCSTLLGKNECGSSETCTVVTEGGDTGCVAIGDREVGESCDESHCGADLACLGQPGARKCFKLCKVSASDCPSAQSCVTSAAFKDGTFGICASN